MEFDFEHFVPLREGYGFGRLAVRVHAVKTAPSRGERLVVTCRDRLGRDLLDQNDVLRFGREFADGLLLKEFEC